MSEVLAATLAAPRARPAFDSLRRPLMAYWADRDGESITTPSEAIFGPKAMIINEYAGSGGDLMPWLFRREKIGPLIGKRTWGGLVGLTGSPELMDGGYVTALRTAAVSAVAEPLMPP